MSLLPFALLQSKSIQLWKVLDNDERRRIYDEFSVITYDFIYDGAIKSKMEKTTGIVLEPLCDVERMCSEQKYAPVQGMYNPSNQCWFDAPVFVLLAAPTGWVFDKILNNSYANPDLANGLLRIHDFMYGEGKSIDVRRIIEKSGIHNPEDVGAASGDTQNTAITLVTNINMYFGDNQIKCILGSSDIDGTFHEKILFVDTERISRDIFGQNYILYAEVYYVNRNHYTAALLLDDENWLFYDDKKVGNKVSKISSKRINMSEVLSKINEISKKISGKTIEMPEDIVEKLYYHYENKCVCITTHEEIEIYLAKQHSAKTYAVYYRVDDNSPPISPRGETKSPPRGETKSPQNGESPPRGETKSPQNEQDEDMMDSYYNNLMNSFDDEQKFNFNLLLSVPIPDSIRKRAKSYISDGIPTAVRFRTNNRSSGVYDRDIRYNHDSLPPFEHALIYDMSAKLVFMGSLRMETPELDDSKVYELFQGDRIKSFDRVKFFYGHHFKHALPAIANIYKNEGRSAPPDTDYAKRVLNMYLQPVIDMASQTGPIRLLDETQKDTLNKIYNDLIPIGELPAARIAMELAEHMNYDF